MGPVWLYEVKWDGYRMQAIKCDGGVRLLSRNGANYTDRFPEVAQAVQALRPATVHLDGELVAIDEQGRPSFQVLQGRRPLPAGFSVGYYAFDLLWLAKQKLTGMPLQERRLRLQEVLAGSRLRFSGQLAGRPEAVVNAVRQHRLEGVVAKRADSIYEAGKRSDCWLKLPLKETGQFVIGGYRGSARHGLVLLLGTQDGARLRFAGKVRHGLNAATRERLLGTLDTLGSRSCPFPDLPNCEADPFDEMVTPEELQLFTWIEPEVVVRVDFTEWTRFGVLRQAEFALTSGT